MWYVSYRDGPSRTHSASAEDISIPIPSIAKTVNPITKMSPQPSRASLPAPRTSKSKSVRLTSKRPPLFLSRYPDDKVANVQLYEDLAAQCDGVLYVERSFIHPESLGLFTSIDIDPAHPAFQPLAEVWGVVSKGIVRQEADQFVPAGEPFDQSQWCAIEGFTCPVCYIICYHNMSVINDLNRKT